MRARTGLCGCGFALLMVLAAAVSAAAQMSTATVQGSVSDSTGVLPGVAVTARETTSGLSQNLRKGGG